MIGDRGGPAHVAFAVLDEHVEERVERVQPALVGDLPERLTDQALIGALDDDGVVKVAVPQRRTELDAVELAAEPAPVFGVGQQLVALAADRADAGPRCRRRTPRRPADRFRRSTTRTAPAGAGTARWRPAAAFSSRVPGPNTLTAAGFDLASADTSRLIRTPLRRPNIRLLDRKNSSATDRVVDVGRALQDPAALAQHLDQPAPLTPRRERRRQRPRAVAVAVELVDRRVHAGHAEQAGVERLVEQLRHLVQFGVGRPDTLGGGAAQAQHRGPQVRMAKQRADIRPQRQIVKGRNVFRGRRPRLLGVQRPEHILARHRLDPAEEVGRVLGVGVDRRQRAVAQQHGGDAVPHRLAQAGIQKDLGVVVGVHVDEAGDDPLARRVDHVRAAGLVQRLGGHGRPPPRRGCRGCGSEALRRFRRTRGRCG